MVDGWVRLHHEIAVRLVKHADLQYETSFNLYWSYRPWAKSFLGQETISGIPGYVWHAWWYIRRGRPFELHGFWRDIRPYHDVILMLCTDSPSCIEMSFSAIDDPQIIADAIGRCFDAAIRNRAFGPALTDELQWQQWRERYAELDPRVQISTPWSSIEESMQRVSVFSA